MFIVKSIWNVLPICKLIASKKSTWYSMAWIQLGENFVSWTRTPPPHTAWASPARAWWRRDSALVGWWMDCRRTLSYPAGPDTGGRGTPPSRWSRGPAQRPGGTRPSDPPWSWTVSRLKRATNWKRWFSIRNGILITYPFYSIFKFDTIQLQFTFQIWLERHQVNKTWRFKIFEI